VREELAKMGAENPRPPHVAEAISRIRTAKLPNPALLGNAGHVLRASDVGAEISLTTLPSSTALRAALPDPCARWTWLTAGGDDYELCFTAAPGRAAAITAALAANATPVTQIGRIVVGAGCRLLTPEGGEWQAPRAGYQHFADDRS
jgi:thiamine-monophosphate kinase